jgi:hypothetical protein
LARQRVPLELAVTDGRSPFQVGISWEQDQPPRLVGDLRFEIYHPDEENGLLSVMPSSSAVTFTVRQTATDLRISCEYNESVLAGEDVDELLAGLVGLLRRQLRSPDAPLADLAVPEAR